MSIRPTIIQTIEDTINTLLRAGLSRDDVIVLIQRRCKGRVNKKQIELVLDAVFEIERQLRRAEKREEGKN